MRITSLLLVFLSALCFSQTSPLIMHNRGFFPAVYYSVNGEEKKSVSRYAFSGGFYRTEFKSLFVPETESYNRMKKNERLRVMSYFGFTIPACACLMTAGYLLSQDDLNRSAYFASIGGSLGLLSVAITIDISSGVGLLRAAELRNSGH